MKTLNRDFLLLLSLLFALPAGAGTYADALEEWRNNARPSFLDQQLNTGASPKQTTDSLSEIRVFLKRYEEEKQNGLGRVLKQLVPVLVEKETEISELDRRLEKEMNLPLLIRVAYARNPSIRSASEAWQAALTRYSQAEYLEGIVRQYNAFTKMLDLRLGMMQKQKENIASEFPFPGVTALRGDIVQTDIRIARQEFAIALRDRIVEVREAFFDYSYLFRAIEITEENRRLLEQMLEVASRRYEAGRASYNDVINSRIELAKISDELKTLREKLSVVKTKLNALLNRAPKAKIGPPEKYPLPSLSIPMNRLYSTAERNRQELEKARLREHRAKLMIRMAEEMNRPDPTLGASYFEDRSALLAGPEPQKPSFRPASKQMLRPWFGEREAFIQEMRYREEQIKAEKDNIRNQIHVDVDAAHFALDTARREVGLYENTLIPEARQSLDVAQRAYETAEIDFLEYLTAQKAWLDFNLSLYKARRDYGRAYAALEKAVGTSLDRVGENQ